MAFNTEQIADILFKKIAAGKSTTEFGRFFGNAEEPYSGRPHVQLTQIWSESNLIPETAAPVPNVVELINVQLSQPVELAGTASFTHASLKNVIPFNFGDGSYAYSLRQNDDSTPIPPGVNDWYLDTETGVLTFFQNDDATPGDPGDLPTGVTTGNGPYITCYKYIGKTADVGGLVGGSAYFADPIIEIIADASSDTPSSTSANVDGDRYILNSNTSSLDAFWGVIVDVEDGDIVEWNGSSFEVKSDVSDLGEGVIVFDKSQNSTIKYSLINGWTKESEGGYTQGSILYADVNGDLIEEPNQKLLWNATNKRLELETIGAPNAEYTLLQFKDHNNSDTLNFKYGVQGLAFESTNNGTGNIFYLSTDNDESLGGRIAIGSNSSVGASRSTAIGGGANTSTTPSTAIGYRATVSAGRGLAITSSEFTTTASNDGIAIGRQVNASNFTVRIGSESQSSATAVNSIGIGKNATVSGTNSVFIGESDAHGNSGDNTILLGKHTSINPYQADNIWGFLFDHAAPVIFGDNNGNLVIGADTSVLAQTDAGVNNQRDNTGSHVLTMHRGSVPQNPIEFTFQMYADNYVVGSSTSGASAYIQTGDGTLLDLRGMYNVTSSISSLSNLSIPYINNNIFTEDITNLKYNPTNDTIVAKHLALGNIDNIAAGLHIRKNGINTSIPSILVSGANVNETFFEVNHENQYTFFSGGGTNGNARTVICDGLQLESGKESHSNLQISTRSSAGGASLLLQQGDNVNQTRSRISHYTIHDTVSYLNRSVTFGIGEQRTGGSGNYTDNKMLFYITRTTGTPTPSTNVYEWHYDVEEESLASNNRLMALDGNGTLSIFNAFALNATTPTTGTTDGIKIFSANDTVDGTASPVAITEDNVILKLRQMATVQDKVQLAKNVNDTAEVAYIGLQIYDSTITNAFVYNLNEIDTLGVPSVKKSDINQTYVTADTYADFVAWANGSAALTTSNSDIVSGSLAVPATTEKWTLRTGTPTYDVSVSNNQIVHLIVKALPKY